MRTLSQKYGVALAILGLASVAGCSGQHHGTADSHAIRTVSLWDSEISVIDTDGHVWKRAFVSRTYGGPATLDDPHMMADVPSSADPTEKSNVIAETLIPYSPEAILSDGSILGVTNGMRKYYDSIKYPSLDSKVATFVKGSSFIAALISDGTVYYSQFANDWTSSSLPGFRSGRAALTADPVLDGISKIFAVDRDSGGLYMLRNDGTVWEYRLFGMYDKSYGLITKSGVGGGTKQVSGLDHVVDLAIYDAGTAGVTGTALQADGSVISWGIPLYHAPLGGPPIDSPDLIPINDFNLSNTRVVKVAAGRQSGGAIDSDGHVWVWGHSELQNVSLNFLALRGHKIRYEGGLGDNNSNNDHPTKIDGIQNAVDLVLGDQYAIVLCKDGSVWAWGNDIAPQLVFKNVKLPQ